MIEVKYNWTKGIISHKLECLINNIKERDHIQIDTTILDENRQKWISQISLEAKDNHYSFTIDDIVRNASFDRIYSKHLFDNLGFKIYENMKKKNITAENYTASFVKLNDSNLILDIRITINNQQIDYRKINCQLKSADISTMVIKDDFIGKYYYKEKTKRPTLVILGGSMGDLFWSEQYAALLSNEGYNTLALSYFSYKGVNNQPRTLTEINLEYFHKSINWLIDREETLGNKTGLIGLSKGGELALLLGSIYKDKINSIIAISPSSYCFEGAYLGKNKNIGSWKLQNKELAFLKYPNNTKLNLFMEPGYLLDIHKKAIEEANTHDLEKARIKVEDIQAPTLIVSGSKDLTWPSSIMCKDMEGKNTLINWVNYENAGHIFNIPHVPPLLESKKQDKEECYKANTDLWEQVINHLK
ncbi:acyl-CoA thioester hydrolase/BAAT C-terminal domain-containing protein [Spirochaeta cellobiosiphila]|uniref:acyl-CoA thioester hydrolase/BAAT C-terminal domain-containing protein n=1 Tax=Spirochaeta cellobiosiphila TaxID=504483 RepID=UPI0003F52B9E|nr:acyl-CoA thioester hydrolase/BAAT C-terminal domain-containing protein [Spirochaeta cellobiosiphila]